MKTKVRISGFSRKSRDFYGAYTGDLYRITVGNADWVQGLTENLTNDLGGEKQTV